MSLIRRGLKELSPDVVGIQEVLSMPGFMSQVDAIADNLGFETATAGEWDLGSGLILGNAILSKHPIDQSKSFALPSLGREPRCLQFASLRTPAGIIPFFNTHLTHRFEDTKIRVEQILAIKELVISNSSGSPAILVGDFNAPPDSSEISTLRNSCELTDCWDYCHKKSEPMQPGHTFSRRNSFALLSDEPSRRIDYIFSIGQNHHKPVHAALAFDCPEENVFASDHFGVFAELELRPIPSSS